ncbi:MAG: glycoside-pentoside-hexuronide (GPH):cation symporter [Clostridiaceae bacterium]|jgi:sugar (glycoside-pentoside-hexuronide) transporter|nr:glycoside-pentoside-hexuronide (GPH):cation symporter [Clostridiaceae bacterium]
MENSNDITVQNTAIPPVDAASGSPEPSKLKTYSKKELGAYLSSMFGQNILYNIIGACLAYYLQFTVLIPAIIVSVIMGAARVWDALNDPMMGTLVDRTRTKLGKCRPFLRLVPIPLMILTTLCFTSFGFYGNGSAALDVGIVAWAAVTYVLWGMVYTVGDIPLWGITALMTENEKDRNKLLSFARIAGGIGSGVVLLAMQPAALGLGDMLAPSVGGAAQGERFGFLIVAAGLALVGAALFQICGFVVKERIPSVGKKPSLKESFKIMWRNKPFRQILLSGILGSPRMLVALVAMPIVTYYFASKDAVQALLYMLILGGGLFAGQFVASALTPKIALRFSKKKLYNYSNLLSAIPYTLFFVLYIAVPRGGLVHPAALVACALIFTLCGAALGINLALQSYMIADAVDYEEYHYGGRPDGVFFSGQTFIAKLTGGVATIISGIAYTIVGFSDTRVAELNAFIEAGGIPRNEPQYYGFMTVLFVLVSLLPAIGCLLSVIPTWKYALTDDEHDRILKELNIKRHAAENDGLAQNTGASAETIIAADGDTEN